MNRNIPALTGLRAVAAYLVFVHHYYMRMALPGPLEAISKQGYVGVSIFYVLSGYLIFTVYGANNRLSDEGLVPYFRNRFARVYPLYFLLCLLSLIALKSASPWAWFLNFTLLKGLSSDWKFSNVAQAWSLTVEECFYASFPIIMRFFRSPRSLLPLLLAIYSVGMLAWIIGSTTQWQGFFANLPFIALYTYFGRAFEFIMGMWCSLLVARRPRGIEHLSGTYIGVAGLFVGMACLAAFGHDAREGIGVYSWSGLAFHNLVLPLTIACLIYGLVVETTILSKTLSTRTAVLLGKSSYAFYLLQQGPLQSVISRYTSRPSFVFAITILISIGMFYVWEEPLHRRIRSWRARPVRMPG